MGTQNTLALESHLRTQRLAEHKGAVTPAQPVSRGEQFRSFHSDRDTDIEGREGHVSECQDGRHSQEKHKSSRQLTQVVSVQHIVVPLRVRIGSEP